jgi:hypothetical protein
MGLAVLASAAVAPRTVAAQQLDIMSQLNAIVQKSSAELAVQINLSGRQRMLTQKMTKEALLVALGIEPEENRRRLKDTMALFERTLKGLINGDRKLRLAPAPNRRIRAQLEKVMVLWLQFRPLVERVAAGATDRPTLLRIARTNLPLLAEMDKAVKLFEKAAGTDTAEIALVINLSGRQRMLTQKMTKEYLLIALDIDREENRRALKATIQLFDTTLKGLLDGNDQLPPTRDPAIRAQLEKVMRLWSAFAPLLQRPPTRENLLAIARANLPLLAEMNRAVKMYEESW